MGHKERLKALLDTIETDEELPYVIVIGNNDNGEITLVTNVENKYLPVVFSNLAERAVELNESIRKEAIKGNPNIN